MFSLKYYVILRWWTSYMYYESRCRQWSTETM